jgi:hypothetical protein
MLLIKALRKRSATAPRRRGNTPIDIGFVR